MHLQRHRFPAVILLSTLAFAGSVAQPATTSAAGNGPTLTVNAGKDRHHISGLIYGVNFADAATARALGLTVDRWGGNSTSRYNYQTGFANTGSDWYFENVPPDTANVKPHIALINGDRASGMETVLTVPLIGWVAKAGSPSQHPYACGFKTAKYGAQDDRDWEWDPGCGNGTHNGHALKGNDPHDTSSSVGPAF